MKFIKDWFKRKTGVTNTETPTESTADFLSRYGATEPVDMVIKYIEDNLDNFTIEIGRELCRELFEVCITDGVVKVMGYYTYWKDMSKLDNDVLIIDDNFIIYSLGLHGLSDNSLLYEFKERCVPLFKVVAEKYNKRKKLERLKEKQETQRQSIEYFTKLLGENK